MDDNEDEGGGERREIHLGRDGEGISAAGGGDGVNKDVIKKSAFDDVVPADIWKGINRFENIGVVGFTNKGKTHFIKQLFADEKIPDIFDKYIIVAEDRTIRGLVDAVAAARYLDKGEWHSLENKVAYFLARDIESSMQYCLDPENQNTQKLIIFSDCLIQNKKNRPALANFLNKAKNYNTTVIIEIHHFAGDENVLLKGALPVQIYMRLEPPELAKLLDIPKNDFKTNRYTSASIKDRIWIKTPTGNYDSNYMSY